jgi:hypothetical protein
MSPNLKLELAMLLEERRLSNFERRKRRLARIPVEVAAEGMLKAHRGEPLTLEEFIGINAGFLPGEREYLERLRLERLPSSARPEPAPAPTLAPVAIKARA